MKEVIENNLRIIKRKIEMNNQLLSMNKTKLQIILKQPVSGMRTDLFTRHFENDLQLFSRNHMLIKVQFELSRSLTNVSGYKSFFGISLS